MNEGSGKGEEVREVCVQYLYLVGESSTRGNARNDGGGVLFFLFSLPPAQQARPQQRYDKLGWIR